MRDIARCSCGRPATCYCDWYFIKLKNSLPVKADSCEKPICDECKIMNGEIAGHISLGQGKSKMVNDTVDYCPEHGKIFKATGKFFEILSTPLPMKEEN